MHRRLAILGITAAVMASAAPALAHHSFAMFDRQKEITLKGTVKEFQWTNPHSFIEIEVPDDKGTITAYSVEMNSPNNLTRQGWKSTSLKVGDKVVLLMNPLRDGSRGGLFVSVMLPDGKVLGDPTRIPGSTTNQAAKPG
ncbi:MAG: DUF6152 family protein [Caulobacteraceae bacterium]